MKLLTFAFAALLSLLFIVLAVMDLSYSFFGHEVEGKVVEYHLEFNGFTNSRTEGTRPKHRGEYSYQFDVDGESFTGHGSGWPVSKVGDTVVVQYINGDPNKNRVLNPTLQMTRFLCWLCFAVGIVWGIRKLWHNRANSEP